MKKIILFVATILLMGVTPLFAQDAENKLIPTSSVNTKYFELSFLRTSQNPLTKSISYTLNIKPLIDSTETEILWNTDLSMIVTPHHKRFVSLKKGEVVSVKATVKPKASGTHDVEVSVISWQHDTNYTDSSKETITLSKNLVIQPVSSEYSTSVILMYVAILIISGVGIFVVIKLVKKGSQKAKKWLTPPY